MLNSDKAKMLSNGQHFTFGYINAPSAHQLCAYSYLEGFLESILINFAKSKKKPNPVKNYFKHGLSV